MGHSIALITDVIAGDSMAEDDAADRQDCVDRNVQHLELMVAKDDWGSEDLIRRRCRHSLRQWILSVMELKYNLRRAIK
jgi:hypothetical protein